MKKALNVLLIIFIISVAGCSNNPVNPPESQNILLYQKQGLVDSIVGTCSAYLIRTYQLDTIDMSKFNNIKINLDAHTDGDLSNIYIYHLQNGSIKNIITLSGTTQINSTNSIIIPSPKINDIFFVRLALFSSICTGQYFHLKLRDLSIYGD